DVTGPMCRTVADATAVLQAVAGDDSNDAATAASRGHVAGSYAASLRRDALRDARIGVLHQAYDTPTTDREIVDVFHAALDELRGQGAVIVDPVAVEGFDAIRRAQTGTCNQFKHDLNRYLAGL